MLEALSIEFRVSVIDYTVDTEHFIGSIIRKVENVLVKSGWFALREISFKVTIPPSPFGNDVKLLEALQSLPDRYLSHLTKLESVAFKYSAPSTSGL